MYSLLFTFQEDWAEVLLKHIITAEPGTALGMFHAQQVNVSLDLRTEIRLQTPGNARVLIFFYRY